MKHKTKWLKTGILCVCLFGMYIMVGCDSTVTPGESDNTGLTQQEEEKPADPVTLKISAVGDVIVHSTQLKAQYDGNTDTYDFNNNFQYVKEYISSADLAICNVETTFGGEERGYSGYPMFNAPDSLASALKNTGFDVGVTANNHNLDTGAKGMLRTIDVLTQNGLTVAGTHKEGEPGYTLFNAKDVTVGIISYTYETPQAGGKRTLNAITIPQDMLSVLNSFGYETFQEDTAAIIRDINDAKDAGAEVIVCVMHWGQEYQYNPSNEDRDLAKQLVNAGADVIFASHPHVIQPVEIMTSDDGRQVPVFFSMGNFLSNQRLETVNNRKTEDGMIASVELEVIKGAGVSLQKTSVISTWVDKYNKNGKMVYEIIPIVGDYKSNPTIVTSGHQQSIEKSKEDSYKSVGNFWPEGD